MTDRASDDDSGFIELLDDGPEGASAADSPVWTVLVVDDDPDVHQATALALRGVPVEGRRIELLHARSAAEAWDRLLERPDTAAMLLDVVMESEDAGLALVRRVREDLGLQALRIILRTGQPGYAPELETIRRHDINDYRTKSELTRTRLYTSLTTAVRAHAQLVLHERNRLGLERIAEAQAALGRQRGLQPFADELLARARLLLERPAAAAAVLLAAEGETPPQTLASHGEPAPGAPPLAAEAWPGAGRASPRFAPRIVLPLGGRDGRTLVLVVDAPLRDDTERHLLEVFAAGVSVALDNVLLHGRLMDLAYRDELSRLPNRNRFVELLDEARREAPELCVAVVDLDDFGGINDAFGHRLGDRLLVAVGARLGEQLGAGVVSARLGGDAFALFGPAALLRPERLAEVFAEPFEVDGEALRVVASCGLVRVSPEAASGAELLKDAYIALKHAKEQQRGAACWFTPAMGTEARERVRLLRGLREAFERRRLYVMYQPQVSLRDRRVVGAEALLRWRNEDGSFVPPDRFIPVAEQSGLIVTLGEYVLRSALHQLVRLRAAGHTAFRMSINVSQVQFRSPGFVEALARALAETGAPPACVELEITESMAAEDVDFIGRVLARIRATGVRTAIDDFGTGFSSLSLLRRLPVDHLKIDRAFVHELDAADAPGGGIARMVVDLGLALGLGVIAEGVETEAQCQALAALGCHEAQGWLFARPMDGEALAGWLAARGGAPASARP